MLGTLQLPQEVNCSKLGKKEKSNYLKIGAFSMYKKPLNICHYSILNVSICTYITRTGRLRWSSDKQVIPNWVQHL